MSQATGALVFGVVAVLLLVPVYRAGRRSRALGDWDLTTTLVFLVGLLASLPTILSRLVSNPHVTVDPLGNEVVGLSGWAHGVDQAANAALLAGALLFFFHRLAQRGTKINVAPLIAVALCGVVAASDALNGHSPFASRQVVLLAILLAAAVARPGRSAFLGVAAVGILLALLGGIEAFVHSGSVFRACRPDKCGPLGYLYTGIFPNEDSYGLPLALSIPFIWVALRGRVRFVLAGYVALSAYLTGSRLSEITAVTAVVLLLAIRPTLTDGRVSVSTSLGIRPAWKPMLAGFSLVVTAVVGFALPFLTLDPHSLTTRPYYWDLARQQLSTSPVYGFGAKAWEGLYAAGQIPVALSHSLQNQWMDIMYAGGIIALAVFIFLLGYVLLRGGAGNFLVAACLIVPVLAASTLERPWSFGINDSLTFTLVAATLIPVARRRKPSEGPAATARRPVVAVAQPTSERGQPVGAPP